MSSKLKAPQPDIVLDVPDGYEHLKRVEWPKDLPGPNHWKLDPNLSGLSKDLKEMAGRVTNSAIRFYQKAKGTAAPMVLGDTIDPDTIHALKIALDRQDELDTAIRPPRERLTELLMSWLQERKKSLVKSMEAVVVVEEGELYDDTDREPWNMKIGKMTDEQVENLRFIFRRVTDRIDAVRVEQHHWKGITPGYTDKTKVLHKKGGMSLMPTGQKAPCWKIEESIMGSLTSEAREAALALYHQGRVFEAAWAKMLATDENENIPVSIVIGRALNLVMQNIDLVWIKRPKGWSMEEEERLFNWLTLKKSVAVLYRLFWTEHHISPQLDGQTIKFDTRGRIFVMEKGEFHMWGVKFLA